MSYNSSAYLNPDFESNRIPIFNIKYGLLCIKITNNMFKLLGKIFLNCSWVFIEWFLMKSIIYKKRTIHYYIFIWLQIWSIYISWTCIYIWAFCLRCNFIKKRNRFRQSFSDIFNQWNQLLLVCYQFKGIRNIIEVI